MNRPKLLGPLALGVATALLLTGCGRSDAETAPESSGAAIDTSPATGEITVWAMGTEGELLPQLVTQFQEENPDAEVNVTAVPWQDYAKKIETAVASGKTPDATMVGASDLASFAAGGGLDPVPEELIDTSDFYPGAAASTTFSGTDYAVPWYVETRSLFYRADLAKDAGLTVPTTWDEYTTFLTGLQAAGAEWGLSLATGAPYSWQAVLPFIWQAGGSATNDDDTAFTFDTPEALEGLTYYQSLIESGIASPNGPTTLGEVEPKFVAGSVGAFVSGPWEMGLLSQAGGADFLENDVAVVPLPSGPEDNASYIGGGHWSVFKDAENRDGAWKFVRWLSTEDTQSSWFDISGDLPAVQSTWTQGALATNPNLAVFGDQLTTARPAPSITTWNEVSAVIDSEIEKVAKGVSTPKQALTEIQSKASSIGTGN